MNPHNRSRFYSSQSGHYGSSGDSRKRSDYQRSDESSKRRKHETTSKPHTSGQDEPDDEFYQQLIESAIEKESSSSKPKSILKGKAIPKQSTAAGVSLVPSDYGRSPTSARPAAARGTFSNRGESESSIPFDFDDIRSGVASSTSRKSGHQAPNKVLVESTSYQIDDEDSFLYGHEQAEEHTAPAPQPETKNHAPTTAEVDTDIMKNPTITNILKSIGFGFTEVTNGPGGNPSIALQPPKNLKDRTTDEEAEADFGVDKNASFLGRTDLLSSVLKSSTSEADLKSRPQDGPRATSGNNAPPSALAVNPPPPAGAISKSEYRRKEHDSRRAQKPTGWPAQGKYHAAPYLTTNTTPPVDVPSTIQSVVQSVAPNTVQPVAPSAIQSVAPSTIQPIVPNAMQEMMRNVPPPGFYNPYMGLYGQPAPNMAPPNMVAPNMAAGLNPELAGWNNVYHQQDQAIPVNRDDHIPRDRHLSHRSSEGQSPRRMSYSPGRQRSPLYSRTSLDRRSRSPDYRGQARDRYSRRSGDRRGRSPSRRSSNRSPDRRGRSPPYRHRSPDRRGRSPDRRGRSPDRRGRSPDRRGRSPDRRGRSPDRRDRSPGMRNKSPGMRERLLQPSPTSRGSTSMQRSPDRHRPSEIGRSAQFGITEGGLSSERSYGFQGRSPNFRERSPELRGRSPTFRGQSPIYRGMSSDIRGRSPDIQGRSPEVRYIPSPSADPSLQHSGQYSTSLYRGEPSRNMSPGRLSPRRWSPQQQFRERGPPLGAPPLGAHGNMSPDMQKRELEYRDRLLSSQVGIYESRNMSPVMFHQPSDRGGYLDRPPSREGSPRRMRDYGIDGQPMLSESHRLASDKANMRMGGDSGKDSQAKNISQWLSQRRAEVENREQETNRHGDPQYKEGFSEDIYEETKKGIENELDSQQRSQPPLRKVHGKGSGIKVELENRSGSPVERKSVLTIEEKKLLDKKLDDQRTRVANLRKELEQLKKSQSEVMRKMRHQKNPELDAVFIENGNLQKAICLEISQMEDDIREVKDYLSKVTVERAKVEMVIRKPAERTYRKPTSLDEQTEEKGEAAPSKLNTITNVFDAGHHLCQTCSIVSKTCHEHFAHLFSRGHKLRTSQKGPVLRSDKPWNPPPPDRWSHVSNKKSVFKGLAMPMKGVELFVPVEALYCTVCKSFVGDASAGATHLKTSFHVSNYEKYILDHPFYERTMSNQLASAVFQVNKPEPVSAPKDDKPSEQEKEEQKRLKLMKNQRLARQRLAEKQLAEEEEEKLFKEGKRVPSKSPEKPKSQPEAEESRPVSQEPKGGEVQPGAFGGKFQWKKSTGDGKATIGRHPGVLIGKRPGASSNKKPEASQKTTSEVGSANSTKTNPPAKGLGKSKKPKVGDKSNGKGIRKSNKPAADDLSYYDYDGNYDKGDSKQADKQDKADSKQDQPKSFTTDQMSAVLAQAKAKIEEHLKQREEEPMELVDSDDAAPAEDLEPPPPGT